MQISECSYCGITGFTENNACPNCQALFSPAPETPPGDQDLSAPPMPESPPTVNPSVAALTLPPRVPPKYTRVVCWKCKNAYNWEKIKICPTCNVALRLHKNEEVTSLRGDPVFSSSAIRSLLITILVIVILAGGFHYLMKSPVETKTDAAQKDAAQAPKEIALPPGAWHQPSIWNFYRQKPTVQEILEKNNQATSSTMSVKDVQTVSLKGNVSIADGGCATDACAQILADKTRRADQFMESKYKGYGPSSSYSTDQFKVGLVDNFEAFDFQPVGTIEAYQKVPDKAFRKVSVTVPKTSRKTETSEGFDGVTGWKKTVISENQQIINSRVDDLMSIELANLKQSTAAWKSDYSDKSITFAHLKKVKNKVHFVLNKPAPEGSEAIYFDAVTGLITRVDSGDDVCFMQSYSDYDGLRLPSVMYFRTIAENGHAIFMKIENIFWTINQPIEDSIFIRP